MEIREEDPEYALMAMMVGRRVGYADDIPLSEIDTRAAEHGLEGSRMICFVNTVRGWRWHCKLSGAAASFGLE